MLDLCFEQLLGTQYHNQIQGCTRYRARVKAGTQTFTIEDRMALLCEWYTPSTTRMQKQYQGGIMQEEVF